MNIHTTGKDVLKENGRGIGSAHHYLERLTPDSSPVWGSDDETQLTIKMAEEMVANAIAADRKERAYNNNDAEKARLFDMIEQHLNSVEKIDNYWKASFGKKSEDFALIDNLAGSIKVAIQAIKIG